LLAIGTTPFSLQSKQLDGLDKTSNLRSVRFTGAATYSIQPGVISRSNIELIPDKMPATLELETAAVTIRKLLMATPSPFPVDLTLLAQREGTDGAYVYIDGGIFKNSPEGLQNLIASIKIDGQIVKSSLEKQVQVTASIKIDNGLVSPAVNQIVKEGNAIVNASIKIGGAIVASTLEQNTVRIARVKIDNRQVASINAD
jgi:hypothetical protein